MLWYRVVLYGDGGADVVLGGDHDADVLLLLLEHVVVHARPRLTTQHHTSLDIYLTQATHTPVRAIPAGSLWNFPASISTYTLFSLTVTAPRPPHQIGVYLKVTSVLLIVYRFGIA